METVASGLALFDYDGDGLIDVYFLNGAPLAGYEADSPPRNALYRNLGGWQFVDVTDGAGVGDTGYGLGVTVGDFDNDGNPDLFVNNFGPNVLYRNNGDSTFTEITEGAGLTGGDEVGAGAAFLDADGDGCVDLYVANYLDFSDDRHITHSARDAVGAQVRVIAGGRSWLAEVHSGRSYQSHYGSTLHFGLGASDRVERIEVRWLAGDVQVLENLPADRVLTTVEASP